MNNKSIDNSKSWLALKNHLKDIRKKSIADLFKENSKRGEKFSVYNDGIYLDFSKNLVNEDTLDLLIKIAENCGLKKEIEAMFNGDEVNVTEKRAALHTLSRDILGTDKNDENSIERKALLKNVKKMEKTALKIVSGNWKGGSGKKIKNIVNIGIGGSFLGPLMTCTALNLFSENTLDIFFISNIDENRSKDILSRLLPEETLFLVVSKSFTTLETLLNFEISKKWIKDKIHSPHGWKNHFIAITSEIDKAVKHGIEESNIIEIEKWIGGRFSVSSPANLSLMLLIGVRNFYDFLRGFNSMDIHFRRTPFKFNIPVLLAIIGIWNINFLNNNQLAVIPYGEDLRFFPDYLQQLEMESNGKSVTREGEKVTYDTAPVIWGTRGTNAQHSFFQMLHQGTKIIPVDFIGYAENYLNKNKNHSILISNMIAQSKALAFGINKDTLKREGRDESLIPHLVCEGNRPSNLIILDELSPYLLGKLISIYEHKTFVQGVIWNINSFDQWGVELGKILSENIYTEIMSKSSVKKDYDSSTLNLIKHFKDVKSRIR